MGKLTKNKKSVSDKYEPNKLYTVEEASNLIKEITTTKFDASVDLAVRLGVDPKKANQMVRGVVSLPHGTGKDMKVLALVTPDKEQEAKDAGADFVGLYEYLDKIKSDIADLKKQNDNSLDSNEKIIKQIKMLSNLKDEGVLTEYEFNDKKKLLLDKLK